jgi:hypothetical protein
MPNPLLPSVHLASTWFLVGLVWFVQLVHYPLMDHVSPDRFVHYETVHRQNILFIVGPAMLLQLASAWWLWQSSHTYQRLWLVNLLFIGLIWLSTFLVQVPLHDELNRQFSAAAHDQLVKTNWFRTLLWSVQGVLSLWLLRKTTWTTA